MLALVLVGLLSQVPSAQGPIYSQPNLINPTLNMSLPLFYLFLPGSTYESAECACTDIVAPTGQSVTWTRSTTAACEKADHTLVTCAANKPRVQAVTGGLGMFLEWAATNVMLYSEQVDQASWGVFGAGAATTPVVTPDVATAPDGTMTADSVHFDAASGILDTAIAYQGIAFGSEPTTMSISVWLKGTTTSTINLFGQNTFNGTPPNGIAGSQFTNCTVTTTWSRCKLDGVIYSGTGTGYVLLGYQNYGGSQVMTSIAAQTIYVWGAQAESGPYATSYIKTTSATVTRAVDRATATNPLQATQPPNWCMAGAGVPIAAWGTNNHIAPSFVSVGSFTNPNSYEVGQVSASRIMQMNGYNDAGTQRTVTTTAVTADTTAHRAIGAVDSNGAVYAGLDGVLAGTTSFDGGIIQPATLYLGTTSFDQPFNGTVYNIKVDNTKNGCTQ